MKRLWFVRIRRQHDFLRNHNYKFIDQKLKRLSFCDNVGIAHCTYNRWAQFLLISDYSLIKNVKRAHIFFYLNIISGVLTAIFYTSIWGNVFCIILSYLSAYINAINRTSPHFAALLRSGRFCTFLRRIDFLGYSRSISTMWMKELYNEDGWHRYIYDQFELG